VSQNNWACENKVTNAATLPVVYVAATNTSLFYMNSYIVAVTKCWDVSVLERDILDRLQDKRWVLNGSAQVGNASNIQGALTTSVILTMLLM
jgi:hypothetical protein